MLNLLLSIVSIKQIPIILCSSNQPTRPLMVESTSGIIQLWILNKLALKVMFVGIYLIS